MSSSGETIAKQEPVVVGRGPEFTKRNIKIGTTEPKLGDNTIRTSKYRLWNFFI